jgi:hypothetical protein
MKLLVQDIGWGSKRTHLTGQLIPRFPRFWYSKYDVVGAIFGFLHHKGSHSGPIMACRWKEAESKMLKRYSVYIPHLKNKKERI